ncbi:AAA family ATPase [Mycobacterium sp. PS03-16]|uniref:septum site-determining protein Ssd n=1 Tax=Mycobacterium sp. PS03-16 TaxID=2559611 RepID=UPI0010730ACE|nr:septum site-determining protein Ssd [Mycobacterium sp. PS03-16]TFV54284.1 AAA family ATPase [Mycobacterium sp. PS03-16]
MPAPPGILAMLTDPALRDDTDRVAAAAAVPVIHAEQPSSPKAWLAAAAVLVDEPAARRCAGRLPRRDWVLMVCRAEPAATDWEAAISVGAQRVVLLPRQEAELVVLLSDAAGAVGDEAARGPVAAVISGRGGAGGSVFAAALAMGAPEALLIDTDPWSGGADLLAGLEDATGLRWPELSLRGGRVGYPALRDALPRTGGLTVLANGRAGSDIDAHALSAVIEAGSRGGATVVCDLARRSTAAAEVALDAADLVVVVATADVRTCAAAAAMVPWLSSLNANVGVVVRGPAPGGLRAAEVAASVGLPLLAAMRPQPALAAALERGGLRIPRRSPLATAARRVLGVLRHHPAVEAA